MRTSVCMWECVYEKELNKRMWQESDLERENKRRSEGTNQCDIHDNNENWTQSEKSKYETKVVSFFVDYMREGK